MAQDGIARPTCCRFASSLASILATVMLYFEPERTQRSGLGKAAACFVCDWLARNSIWIHFFSFHLTYRTRTATQHHLAAHKVTIQAFSSQSEQGNNGVFSPSLCHSMLRIYSEPLQPRVIPTPRILNPSRLTAYSVKVYPYDWINGDSSGAYGEATPIHTCRLRRLQVSCNPANEL